MVDKFVPETVMPALAELEKCYNGRTAQPLGPTSAPAGEKGLITYLMAGCPDYGTSLAAILAAVKAGSDIIEIGIPFSDPLADGVVIEKATKTVLNN